jgi:hypothetical protein
MLLIAASASAAAIGVLLVRGYSGEELTELNLGLEIVIFVFTASAGLLALIRYWNSVEADLEHKRWEKLNHLETCYQGFLERHLHVIQAFDYPHILREEYLPLCEKAVAYDNTDPEKQASILTSDEMAKVRQFDNFLEFFENLFFALSHRLVSVEDMLVFLRYYIILLGEAYYDPKEQRVKRYIDQYYYNIVPLLDLVEKQLRKEPEHSINRKFENYPRR